jgi:seryl-tRNA synthetase
MLQVNFIRQHIDLVKERIAHKHFSDTSIVDTIVALDTYGQGPKRIG